MKFSLVLIALLFFSSAVFASDLMALHGKATDSGATIISGDLRVLIYNQESGGTLIYDSGTDFNGSIVNGIFDVMLGSSVTLDLNYGTNYWMDLEINGNDLDFSGSERKKFEASRGLIDNTDLDAAANIAWNKISKTNSSLSELGFDLDFNNTYLSQRDGNSFYVLASDGNQWYYSQADANSVFVKQVDGNLWYPQITENESITGNWDFINQTTFGGGFGSGGITIQDGIAYLQSIVIVNDFNAATIQGIDINGNHTPSIHNTFDLGSDSRRWKTIYGADANFTTISVPANAISWTFINKSGSNLTDLETRNHNDLQNISGGAAGDYFHLTNAQHSNLTSLNGVWETINSNSGSTSANAFPDSLSIIGSDDINVSINGDVISIDFNGSITSSGTDTNWMTSWSVFDANMSSYYIKISDSNNTGRLNYGVIANAPWITSANDSNAWTAGIINDSNIFDIDLNTLGNLHAEGNYLCDSSKCYLISDLNQMTETDLTNYLLQSDANAWFTKQSDANKWFIKSEDGNSWYAKQSDVNLWFVKVEDSNNSSWLDYTVIANPPWLTSSSDTNWMTSFPELDANLSLWLVTQNDGNSWYAFKEDVNIWINSLTFGSSDFNSIYLNSISDTDTNWMTSWETFDANMRSYFIAINDSNNSGRLNYTVIADAPWITEAGSDTNWMTSWNEFDLNLSQYYVKQSDGNSWFVLVSDSNNLGRLDYGVIANAPWITESNSDTNFMTFNDFNSWYVSWIDGNAIYVKQSDGNNWYAPLNDVNLWINARTWDSADFNAVYLNSISDTDTNWMTSFSELDANLSHYYVKQFDGNAWYAFKEDVNSWGDLRYAKINDVNLWGDARYAGKTDVNLWIDNLTFGSNDFNSVYLNTLADTDTNWQTSWNIFDANLSNYYIRIEDSNSTARLDYQVIANPPWITEANADTNWMTSFPELDANLSLWLVTQEDGNLWYAPINDVNLWINSLTFGSADFNTEYKNSITDTDSNFMTFTDFNQWYYSQLDANNTFIKISDSNNLGRLTYEVIANPPWLTTSNDTNWQTSFSELDLNLRNYFVSQSDGNSWYLLIQDLNNNSSIEYTAIANAPWITSSTDTNWQTSFPELDANLSLWLTTQEDANTWFASNEDVNIWIDNLTFGNSDFNSVYLNSLIDTDSNFMTFNDFNSWYVSWNDGNKNYYTQTDLNSLLQIPDFNSMIINLGETQGWNTTITDTDTNWQTSWNEFDTNMSSYYIKISDSNNIARIYYETIADWNSNILNSNDWNALGITDDVNTWINDLTFNSSDFNSVYLNTLADTDTNFMTFNDFNLWYYSQLDANSTFIKISDSNNTGRLNYSVIANPPSIPEQNNLFAGTFIDVNSQTGHILIAGNESDLNSLIESHINQLTFTDTNWNTEGKDFKELSELYLIFSSFPIGDANISDLSWSKITSKPFIPSESDIDANALAVINSLDLNNSLDYLKTSNDTNWQTSFPELDANLSLWLVTQSDGNLWYAPINDVNLWINSLTFGSADFNSEYKNTDTVVLRTYTGEYGIAVDSDANTIQIGNDFNSIYDSHYILQSDGNAWYLIQSDANSWYWKQTDLNSILQISDFNNVWLSETDANTMYPDKNDVNTWINALTFDSDDFNSVYLNTLIDTDTNFMTFPDFNSWYVSWIDGNSTYYTQTDLNSLLQIPDFNSMIINLGENQNWNALTTDTNIWSEGVLDDVNRFNIPFDQIYYDGTFTKGFLNIYSTVLNTDLNFILTEESGNAGYHAGTGSILFNVLNGELWLKTGSGFTDWNKVATHQDFYDINKWITQTEKDSNIWSSGMMDGNTYLYTLNLNPQNNDAFYPLNLRSDNYDVDINFVVTDEQLTAGYTAEIGSIGFTKGGGIPYVKTGNNDEDWNRLVTEETIKTLVPQYSNDTNWQTSFPTLDTNLSLWLVTQEDGNTWYTVGSDVNNWFNQLTYGSTDFNTEYKNSITDTNIWSEGIMDGNKFQIDLNSTNNIYLDGDSIYIDFKEAGDAAQYIYFGGRDNPQAFNISKTEENNFQLSAWTSAPNFMSYGNIYINYDGADGTSYLYFYEGSSPTGEYLRWNNTTNLFDLSDDLSITGTLTSSSTITASSTITGANIVSNANSYINYDGGEADSSLYFYEDSSATGEYLKWENSTDNFLLSDDTNVNGVLTVSSNIISQGNLSISGNTTLSGNLTVETLSAGTGNVLYIAGEYLGNLIQVQGDPNNSDDLIKLGDVDDVGSGQYLEIDGSVPDFTFVGGGVTINEHLTVNKTLTVTDEATFSGEVKGSKVLLCEGFVGKTISTDGYLQNGGGATYTDRLGCIMPRAGSITDISTSFNISVAGATRSATMHARVNASSVFNTGQVDCSSTGDTSGYATQVRGTDTFSAGDVVTVYVSFSFPAPTIQTVLVQVWGYFDE
ncbi:MAG: hypothetical protein JW703_02480 [Candidatus Diapherotrites archaeon]|nr:hypothetical protein [Candidatus Diapherotrites archaeon]